MQLLTERYNKKIQGVIACYLPVRCTQTGDRIVIHGTLPGFNYAQGMTSFLNDISFFKRYREVVKRDGTTTRKYAHMRKNISTAFMTCKSFLVMQIIAILNLYQVSRILKRLHLHGLIKCIGISKFPQNCRRVRNPPYKHIILLHVGRVSYPTP